jgi:transglutaminase-like putative cysteine protease
VRFQLTHKLTTYLLSLAALSTLLAANLVSGQVALAAVVLGAASWFVDPGTRAFAQIERAAPLLRLVVVAFFAINAYQVWKRLPEPDLTPILSLVVFLTVYKLFARSANRDYLQIYVLAFLMVLAGAAFAQSFVFVPAFVVYVVLTTWALILLHLRREMEDNYLVKHATQVTSHKVGVARILNSRRVIGGPFLAAMAGVALMVVLGAMVTFALVPRVGTGFAFGGQRSRRTLIGFSDEVTLGTSGFLSDDNDTVALRAVLPSLARLPGDRAREAAVDGLYWRGTVYESYHQGRWLRARREFLRTSIVEAGGPALVREPRLIPPGDLSPPLAGTERQEIDIVGVSAPVAFALDHPVAFELPPPKFGTLEALRLVPRWSGEVAFRSLASAAGGPGDHSERGDLDPPPPDELHTFAGAHYIAYSRDPQTTVRATSGRPLAEIPAEVLEPYLAVPPELTPELTALARSITAGKTTAIDKIIAITSWLDRTHAYSVDLDRTPRGRRDPVADFLFERKLGHCEYFASAAALLLRTVGVPTRYVNGFLGGEWNAVGHYVTVRQNRAHAWVEAYLGELGWARVDATPPVRPSGRMGRLGQLFDSIDFVWGRWIVGYDLGRQIDIARNFGRGLGLVADQRAAGDRGGGTWLHLTRRTWVRLGALAVMACAVTWFVRRRRRRRRFGRAGIGGTLITRDAVGRLYERSLGHLAGRGYPRLPSETPREFSRRVMELEPVIAGRDDFGRLTELYLRSRFGQERIADGPVAELGKRLTELGWFTRAGRAAQDARAA